MDVRALPDEFDPTVPLHSDALSLRPLQAEDRAALTEAAADPAIWAGHPSSDRWKAEVFAGYFDFLLEAGGALVVRDGSARVIGASRYYASSDAPDGIGIGFTFLVCDHWGGATNFEMKRLMLGHVFASVPEVWFHIAPTNIRSQKATAKLGAERAEDRRLDLGTGPADWVRMRLSRARWTDVSARHS